VTNEQLEQVLMKHAEDITTALESGKSAHHRIGEMKELTESVNKLALEMSRVAEKVEQIVDRMDKSIERIENGQRGQGERIGTIEKAILTIERNEKALGEHEKRLDEIDKAPGEKWNKATWLIVAGIITAVVNGAVGFFRWLASK
jgi:chromosome segregation ATPase